MDIELSGGSGAKARVYLRRTSHRTRPPNNFYSLVLDHTSNDHYIQRVIHSQTGVNIKGAAPVSHVKVAIRPYLVLLDALTGAQDL